MTKSDTQNEPAKRPRGRAILINGALIAGSLIVLLVVLELFVRIFFLQRHGLEYIQADPDLGWMQRPNAHYEYQRENAEVSRVSTNAYGLRSPDIALEKPDGTFRILIIGDSFVQGLAVNDESTFCRKLETALNEQPGDRRYEVVNGGVDGFSPVQEMLLLERFMSVYDPDLVVQVFFAGNDFMDNTDPAGGRRPRGRLNDAGELVVVPPRKGGAPSMRARVLEKIQLAFLLRFKILPGIRGAQRRGPRARNLDLDNEWAILARSLERSHALTLEHGSGYALALIATPDDSAEEEESDAASPFDEAEQIQRLIAFCNTQSIPLLDLTAALQDLPGGQKVYFEGVGHFTEYGHAKAAKALRPFVDTLSVKSE